MLCDHGCTASFDSSKVTISYNNVTILEGFRDPITRLWRLPLLPPASTHPPTIHSVTNTTQTSCMANVIRFYHATLFSPSISTFIHAVKNGYFRSWPGLSVRAIKRHLRPSPAMVKGHMDQTRCNQSSPVDPTPQEPNNAITNLICATVEPFGRIYTDQTGRFPHPSSRGYKYILILYSYDANAILAEPIKQRTDDAILAAYTTCHQHLVNRGFTPSVHWLDNEASTKLKQYNTAHNISYQLTPPHVHRRNAAERAIRTWKNHFIAGLCSVNPSFPMHLWDRLIPQATATLNMLRPCRRNPKMSAYMALEGANSFTSTPMAPPGTRIIVHEKPTQRGSWAPHGIDGWYLGPAMDHHKCYRTFIPSTQSERVSDTIRFLHH